MIPISIPDLSPVERQYVIEAIESTWISSSGEFLSRFERMFASDVAHSQHALAVTNGTMALYLALAALEVGPGDEVIVPSLTYIATANAVRYLGATPVFADVDSGSWGISADAIQDLVTNKTVGVIAVHLYGHPADMDAINSVARGHGLWVVEDAAEAPFATYRGRNTGALADIATFSFYGNKILTSGEGGAVTTDNDNLADRMRLLRGQGMDPQRRYFFPVVGYNFRMTNVAAAILVGQLERHAELLAARRRVFGIYNAVLAGKIGVSLQPCMPWATISPWLYCVTLATEIRDAVMADLGARGIETRPFFIPIHQLPPYRGDRHGPMAVTDALASSGINLPTFPSMSEEDAQMVATSLLECLPRW